MDPLGIIHVSARFVVVNKPAGLLSVPGKPTPGGRDHQDCVASRVQALFPAATGPLIVHRLDMETSGLMVLGLDADAHRDLSRQFERRSVEKAYVALVSGRPSGDSGRIALPVRPDIERRPIQIVDRVQARAAITDWRITERCDGVTRLALVPRTGRTHQLRLHLSHPEGLGTPILGDGLYGGPPAARLMLHAEFLAFSDPHGGRRLEFSSPAAF